LLRGESLIEKIPGTSTCFQAEAAPKGRRRERREPTDRPRPRREDRERTRKGEEETGGRGLKNYKPRNRQDNIILVLLLKTEETARERESERKRERGREAGDGILAKTEEKLHGRTIKRLAPTMSAKSHYPSPPSPHAPFQFSPKRAGGW
jgi:hypothetical protein